jgi:hypothetical protein
MSKHTASHHTNKPAGVFHENKSFLILKIIENINALLDKLQRLLLLEQEAYP